MVRNRESQAVQNFEQLLLVSGVHKIKLPVVEPECDKMITFNKPSEEVLCCVCWKQFFRFHF